MKKRSCSSVTSPQLPLEIHCTWQTLWLEWSLWSLWNVKSNFWNRSPITNLQSNAFNNKKSEYNRKWLLATMLTANVEEADIFNFLFWPGWTISTSFKMHKSKKDFFSFYKSWEAHLRMCNHPQGSQERKRPSALLAWVATWNRIAWWLTSGRLLLLWQNTNTRKSVCNTNITKPFEGKSGQLSVVLILFWNRVAWSPFGRVAPCVKKFWLEKALSFPDFLHFSF